MITIKINGVDRTNLLDWQSVNLTTRLTSQVDTLDFVLKKYGSKNYKPTLLDDVEFFDGADKIFGGKIVEMEEGIQTPFLEVIRISCKDHTHEMDRRLVIKVYENQTINFIINDIKTNFLPAGFTTVNVNAPLMVNYIAFNYEQPSKCFQQLAELVGYDWYVDQDKDIHFFAKETTVAPFSLTDTNDNYFFNSLVIRRSIQNLRNTIFVRGGEFRGTNFIEKETADGVAKVFKQGFRYSNIVVKKGGVIQTVGIDNIDDPTAKDVLYNFAEKAVKFRDDNKPANGVEVEVNGLPHIPVIIKTKDNVSITDFGEFEHKIIDKSINSKEGARDRAKAEVIAWAQKVNEGSFITNKSGLRVGQRFRIHSTIRGIDEYFIINEISAKMKTPTELNYEVILMTTQTFGAIEFLQKLLMQKDKEIEISTDEVLDKIEAAFETIILTEAFVLLTDHNRQLESASLGEIVTVQALNFPVIFVYGPFAPPSGFSREGKYDGAVYS